MVAAEWVASRKTQSVKLAARERFARGRPAPPSSGVDAEIEHQRTQIEIVGIAAAAAARLGDVAVEEEAGSDVEPGRGSDDCFQPNRDEVQSPRAPRGADRRGVTSLQGWVQQIGFGTGSDASVSGAAVAVSAGNVWIAGSTTGTFPGQTGHGVDQSDAFVAKFDAENGTQLKILQFGSDANDGATGIAVDAGGNAFVAGMTGGAGGSDIFVAKIDPNGNLK